MAEMKFDKKVMKNVVDGIIDGFEKEQYDKYIDEVKKLGINKKDNVDAFYWKFIKPMYSKMIVMIDYYTDKKDYEKKYELEFLIQNYNFIKNNFERMITKYEGTCCCADKSRRIIKLLFIYFKEGKYPDKMDDFATTRIVFIEFDDILRFFNGLYFMYFGNKESYIREVNYAEQKAMLLKNIRKSVIFLRNLLYNKLSKKSREDAIFNISFILKYWQDVDMQWDSKEKIFPVFFIIKKDKTEPHKVMLDDLLAVFTKNFKKELKENIILIFKFFLKYSFEYAVDVFNVKVIKMVKNYLQSIIE